MKNNKLYNIIKKLVQEYKGHHTMKSGSPRPYKNDEEEVKKAYTNKNVYGAEGNHYKKDLLIKDIIFDLMEFYFRKLNSSFSKKISMKYSYFLKRISDTKFFNLDEESLFVEFEEEILDG